MSALLAANWSRLLALAESFRPTPHPAGAGGTSNLTSCAQACQLSSIMLQHARERCVGKG